jgi:hypothetical protein
MSIVTPHVRKHLSADALFHVVRSGFADIPDPRSAGVDISLTDTLMSAFAMFSLKAPSLLAFDKERAEGNLHTLALDGTGYFSSTSIHCASCLHTVHRNGSVTYAHQMLGAAIIHPDVRAVIPLMPEPIGQDDGTDKNDCERNAAKRFVVKLRQDHPHLKFIVTEDSLSSNAPHIETLQHHDLHYILGVKEGDHTFLFQQIQAAEHAGRVTS